MSFRKVLILVEGQTEESFVKNLLSNFMPEGLFLQPVVVATKRVKSGGKFKGGVPSYAKVKGDVLRLLGDSSAVMVTSMLDYDALPTSFPGRATPSGATAEERVCFVENAWSTDTGHPRFRAYLSLHEFEALLFSNLAFSHNSHHRFNGKQPRPPMGSRHTSNALPHHSSCQTFGTLLSSQARRSRLALAKLIVRPRRVPHHSVIPFALAGTGSSA